MCCPHPTPHREQVSVIICFGLIKLLVIGFRAPRNPEWSPPEIFTFMTSAEALSTSKILGGCIFLGDTIQSVQKGTHVFIADYSVDHVVLNKQQSRGTQRQGLIFFFFLERI